MNKSHVDFRITYIINVLVHSDCNSICLSNVRDILQCVLPCVIQYFLQCALSLHLLCHFLTFSCHRYISNCHFFFFLKKKFKFKVLVAQVISSNDFNCWISTILRFVTYNPLMHQNIDVWDSWTEAVSWSFIGDSTCINIINCLQYKM